MSYYRRKTITPEGQRSTRQGSRVIFTAIREVECGRSVEFAVKQPAFATRLSRYRIALHQNSSARRHLR
jgi:hypothetical protein